MWRARRPQQRTTNLCNQFMVLYLQKKKTQLERTGMDRKALVYQTAILKIQKYPIPIICMQQLRSIYGIGQLLANQLIKVIQDHYRSFLKQKTLNNIHQTSAEQEPYIAQEQGEYENKWSIARSNTLNKGNDDDVDDSKSEYSTKSANFGKSYKPRPKTFAAYLMMSIKLLANQGFVNCQLIKKCLRDEYSQKVTDKSLALTIGNLAKQGYLSKDIQDPLSICLSSKGLNELEVLEAKTKIKESQNKIRNIVSSFMSKPSRQLKKEQKNQEKMRETIMTQQNGELVLLIDNRQMKDKQEQCFFQSRLREKYNVRVESANLPLGDFMWLYNGHVLDFIIERKKADDLVSSIFDGRYKEQKYRLKNSGFKNIYYLFEGHLTGSNAKSERQVNSALMNTRIRQKFKVVQVTNINQSIKFISFLNEQINQMIRKQTNIETLGLLSQYAGTRSKSALLTVEHIFGLSLKTIPGVGANSVNEILKYFGSFGVMHRQLKGLESRQERIQFLKGLLKGVGIRLTLPELLVDLLFGDN